MDTIIYVLKLSNNKWYIGKSDDPAKRYQEHINGVGSAWTNLYKPISLEKIIKGNVFDEDKITKEYMSRYGIENVRGGSYVQIELSDFHKDALKMEIRGAKNLCFQCGRSGHFVRDCYANTEVSVKEIEYEDEWGCDYCERTFTTRFGCMIHEKSCKDNQNKNACYRCGRSGHFVRDCYANTEVSVKEIEYEDEWGCEYCERTFTTQFGCMVHEKSCKDNQNKNACYRCGRQGHYSPDCYASRHIKGYEL